MADITIEKADYVIYYYGELMTLNEKKAQRHHLSMLKLEDSNDQRLTRMYLKTGWLSDDPLILNYLNDGYIQFVLNCAERILKDNPEKVLFNFCPVCKKLARTPHAKQCRHCGYNWH